MPEQSTVFLCVLYQRQQAPSLCYHHNFMQFYPWEESQ